jgi:voltage-gated potassium channel
MAGGELKATIKTIIEQTHTKAGLAFSLTVQGLIVVSLVSFSLDTVPDLSDRTSRILELVEVVTVLLFTAEFLLRLYVADHKWRFAGSFYGLVDLLAILPFYVGLIVTSFGIDFRAIRIVRLLRLFRTFKLLRYSKAIRLFGRAFVIARE